MVDTRYTIRDKSRLPFEAIARAILPSGYQLSLVICGDDLAQRMNKEYRKKTYKPNVLSFPISKNEGEIFLNIRKAEREARTMGIPANWRIAHLFIHGCAHLKGHDHSDSMDALESKVLRKFGFKGIPH
ncbi:MAG: rRNA maturation RNase YbeY [Parcubacteria group bacterium RIFCSPHIGHO2_01_FULL_56_18]|nr:MAG: rRNA maturation RNase YbeY [Parcubacteria group bacterium RIFCSPHIGHO2_01_FULL_56_18]